jgi:hypothetical protein
MILEGLVTTLDSAGRPHVAAMGPAIEEAERAAGAIRTLLLRPFPTSATGANLVRSRAGVFHLCDDVLLLARVVAGAPPEPPATLPATRIAGHLLADACRAYEFEVEAVDDSAERLRLTARVVAEHALRPFLGFSRAAHAVVEAAILVTRLHLLEPEAVRRQLADLAVLVEKTGGGREREAFDLLAARAGRGEAGSPPAQIR